MKIDREKLKALAEISIYTHEEDFPPEDSFDNPDDVQWAKDQLARGNEWGWCCVEVRATFGDFMGRDFLGGCSYESEAKFTTPDGYYPGMVNEAVEELAQSIEKAMARIELVKEKLS